MHRKCGMFLGKEEEQSAWSKKEKKCIENKRFSCVHLAAHRHVPDSQNQLDFFHYECVFFFTPRKKRSEKKIEMH